MTQYKGRGGDCFLSSLANHLLFVHNDAKTASLVHRRGLDHLLVFPGGGTVDLTWPILVRDLTNQRYRGTLFIKRDFDLPEEIGDYVTLYDIYNDRALYYFDQACLNGSDMDVYFATKFRRNKPVILGQDFGEDGKHAILLLTDKTFISDGRFMKAPVPFKVTRYFNENLLRNPNIYCMLEIEKNTTPQINLSQNGTLQI